MDAMIQSLSSPRSRSRLHSFLVALLATLLVAAGSVTCRPPAPPEEDPRIAAVEAGISRALQVQGREVEGVPILERMAHYRVPGASVAVLDGGRIAWARGYGVADVGAGDPVTPETLFQAASISKPVAAMAALKLVEQGVLDLDAPVNPYLRDWKIPENAVTREHPVTLKHILTHSGGLTVHGFPGYAVTAEIPSTVEVLDGAGPANTVPVRVDTIPGSLWRYSGGGYTVLQKLLEDVTGKPFPQVVRDLVLDPAGMTLSGYEQPLPPDRAGHAATGHLQDGQAVEGRWHVYPEMAAAGLWTTPTDLAKLALDVQASARGERGGVLSPEMTQAQLTPVMGGYGLGFGVQGEGAEARFVHGGSNHGFKAQFLAFREGGRGVFVMTNGDGGSALAQEIALAVAREYGWPAPAYQEVVLGEVAPEILQEIAGVYRVEGQDLEVRVEARGDHLRADVGGTMVLELYPTADGLFLDLDDGTRIRVERDAGGGVIAFQVLGGPRAVRAGG